MKKKITLEELLKTDTPTEDLEEIQAGLLMDRILTEPILDPSLIYALKKSRSAGFSFKRIFSGDISTYRVKGNGTWIMLLERINKYNRQKNALFDIDIIGEASKGEKTVWLKLKEGVTLAD